MKSFTACLLLIVPFACASGPRVYWVDVEGGAATLLVTPAGESILIDTGMPGERDPGRIAKLARELAGLERIDHLVLSHFDIDHFGGAADLAKLIPIGTVYETGGAPWPRYKKVFEAYQAMKAEHKVVVMKPGMSLPLKQLEGTPFTARCLAVGQQFIDPLETMRKNTFFDVQPERKAADTSKNANSIVLLFRFGAFDFLDGADLTWNMEEQLVWPINKVGTVDVFQVNHHGLDSSNNPALIRSVAPRVAVMNNGDRKGCGPNTAATLKSTKSIEAVYQLHKCLRDDGEACNTQDAFIANHGPGKGCQAHHIELQVAADGASYEVRIPASGHVKRFESKAP